VIKENEGTVEDRSLHSLSSIRIAVQKDQMAAVLNRPRSPRISLPNDRKLNFAELTILSFGAGQDSTAILHMYLNDAKFRQLYAPKRTIVIVSATLNEHPATNEHIARMAELCKERGVEYIYLTPDMGFHPGAWKGGLVGQWQKHNTIGSVAYPKTCSHSLKITPIWNYVEHVIERDYGYRAGYKRGLRAFTEQFGNINCLIGISKGEESRIAKSVLQPMLPMFSGVEEKVDKTPKWLIECVNRLYPLIDLQMDRSDCIRYIADSNEYVPPPSNCVFCPYKSHREVWATKRKYPALFEFWLSLEAAKKAAWEGRLDKEGRLIPNYGVKGKTSLAEYADEAERRYGHLSLQELEDYIFTHGHCNATKF
jgi:hypothetical protein